MARRTPSPSRHPTERLVGEVQAIQTLRERIRYLAAFDAVGNPHVPTLLLHGETGTGKGLIARLVHDSGPRTRGSFVDVNCGALPETMLEAELFGFEVGAFTDAKRGKPGLFEAAAGGTLFLDEIDALPLALQSKLLTAVEEKRVRRLGAVVSHGVDIKLIAATQVDLPAAVQAGRFRADLYHRLAVIILDIPPLRERGDDVLLLAERFLRQYAAAHRIPPKQLSAAAAAWLRQYSWPGNVRELAHLMERLTLLCLEAVLEPALLVQWSLSGLPAVAATPPGPVEAEPGPADEPARIREALAHTGGNITRAAKLLGWSRKALRYRLRRYGIEPHSTAWAPAAPGPEVAASPDREVPPSGLVPMPVAAPPEPRPESAPPPDALPPASGWEQRTVAVLAIDLTLPRAASLTNSPAESWEVLQRWEEAMAEKIQECGGVLLRRSPPLLVAAFGLPHALAQMPHRAVHAALTIRRLLEDKRLTAGHEAGPELRQALHLGPVLVDVGAPDPVIRLPPVGETLTVPMRLIGHTAPGEILASAQAARLLEIAFALQARELPLGGEHPATLTAYAITGRRPRPVPPEGLTARPRSRFTGRKRELAMLHELLAEAEAGRGQVVGIVGEAGMGKSRLLWEFRQRLTGQQVHYLEGHCMAYTQATPYLPVLEILRQQADIAERDRPAAIAEKVRRSLQAVGIDPEASAPLLFHLLDLQEGLEPVAGLTPQALKARTFETLSHWFYGISQQQPLVLVVEDLHWIDQTSNEFLAAWVERLAAARTVLLCTYRPGYQPPWLHKSYTTQLSLKPLSRQDSQCVLQSVLPTDEVPDALTQTILSKAEGNPFFLEELAYTVREQGPHHVGLTLPETIQGVLMVRIDGLPEPPKRLLHALAVIGKPCAANWLTQILDRPADELHDHLAFLQRGEFIYEQPASPEPKYGVKHALIQDTAYEAQGLERRQEQHRRVAQAIEALGLDRLWEYSGELAHHYQLSGDTTRSVRYHQQAGQWAMQRSAFGEALSHFTTAIEQLHTLPETPRRTQQELDLWIALGPALLATQGPGAAEVEQAYNRARELCQQVDDTPQLFPALVGLWRHYQLRAEQRTARDLGERLLQLAQRQGDAASRVMAHRALGQSLFYLGDLTSAHPHLEAGVALYTPPQRTLAARYGTDPAVPCLYYAAHTLWLLGYPCRARDKIDTMLTLVQDGADLFSLAVAHFYAARLYLLRSEPESARDHVEALIPLATEQGFRSLAVYGTILQGSVLSALGEHTEGLARLRQGLAAHRDVSTEATRPMFLGLLASAYAAGGPAEEGLPVVDEALALVERYGVRYYEAELYRLKGALLLQLSAPDFGQAEACLAQALDIARRQQAKSWELRAAMNLARLWQHQGKHSDARQLLTETYAWFTEGFATADLQEANTLIDALS